MMRLMVKKIGKTIIEMLYNTNVLGVIVWFEVNGWGTKDRFTVYLEGLVMN
jgi:hypothetical protein